MAKEVGRRGRNKRIAAVYFRTDGELELAREAASAIGTPFCTFLRETVLARARRIRRAHLAA